MKATARVRPGARDPERGAVAISAYIFMLVMLAFLALSLNTGIMMDTRTELQNGSDSAALAAAGSLDGTMNGIAAARTVASAYSAEHKAFDEDIAVDENDDVSFGRWHLKAADCQKATGSATDCFEPLTPAADNVDRINAVRVDNGRDGLRNSALTLPFGHFVGRATGQVTSGAVAIGPGVGQPACAMPFVVAECKIRNAGVLKCGESAEMMDFSDANSDEVGFVNLTDDNQSPSGTWVADFIKSGQMCNGPAVGTGKLNNGNSLQKVVEVLRGEDGGECLIGKTYAVAVTPCSTGTGGGGGTGNGTGNGSSNGNGTGNGSGNGGKNKSSTSASASASASATTGSNGNSDTSTQFQGDKEIIGFVNVEIVAVVDNKNPIVARRCGDEIYDAGSMTLEKNSILLKVSCDTPAGNPGGVKMGPGESRVRIVK